MSPNDQHHIAPSEPANLIPMSDEELRILQIFRQIQKRRRSLDARQALTNECRALQRKINFLLEVLERYENPLDKILRELAILDDSMPDMIDDLEYELSEQAMESVRRRLDMLERRIGVLERVRDENSSTQSSNSADDGLASDLRTTTSMDVETGARPPNDTQRAFVEDEVEDEGMSPMRGGGVGEGSAHQTESPSTCTEFCETAEFLGGRIQYLEKELLEYQEINQGLSDDLNWNIEQLGNLEEQLIASEEEKRAALKEVQIMKNRWMQVMGLMKEVMTPNAPSMPEATSRTHGQGNQPFEIQPGTHMPAQLDGQASATNKGDDTEASQPSTIQHLKIHAKLFHCDPDIIHRNPLYWDLDEIQANAFLWDPETHRIIMPTSSGPRTFSFPDSNSLLDIKLALQHRGLTTSIGLDLSAKRALEIIRAREYWAIPEPNFTPGEILLITVPDKPCPLPKIPRYRPTGLRIPPPLIPKSDSESECSTPPPKCPCRICVIDEDYVDSYDIYYKPGIPTDRDIKPDTFITIADSAHDHHRRSNSSFVTPPLSEFEDVDHEDDAPSPWFGTSLSSMGAEESHDVDSDWAFDEAYTFMPELSRGEGVEEEMGKRGRGLWRSWGM